MLPNALLPLVTVAGINLGLLLGGAVVTETVFSWPGVGRLIVQSVSQRDYPVIIAGVFLISLIFVVINLDCRHPVRASSIPACGCPE